MPDGTLPTDHLRRLTRFRSAAVAACACVAFLTAGCDESFEPTAPTDLTFSVFGYLDASADTQWIRVMPIRPLRTTSPDALGATVTLEDLATGRIIPLRDSLFTFSSPMDSAVGSEGVYLHNFWTTDDIEPGASYRFAATRDGLGPAEAIVDIPRDYDVEMAVNQYPGWGATDELRVTGLKHLPFVTAMVHFYDGCGAGVLPIPFTKRAEDGEAHVVTLVPSSVQTRDGCGAMWVAKRELQIVGSEAAWPTTGYSQNALGPSGQASNITTAVGYLGGVLSRVVPYENCKLESTEASTPTHCRLRYSPETATVHGSVQEPRCFGPLDSVTVRLTEIGPDPARVRTVLTDAAGEFLIGALEPGIRHALWVRAPQVPIDSMFDLRRFQYVYTEWADIHTLRTDTLSFETGQQLRYDIDLERLIACDELHPVSR